MNWGVKRSVGSRDRAMAAGSRGVAQKCWRFLPEMLRQLTGTKQGSGYVHNQMQCK